VRSLRVPLAPLPEQRRIVAKIEEFFSLAHSIETVVKKVKERAERIDQAILVKAFRGELVPQDPNDEPGSALLQRIKATTKQRTGFQKKLTE
jgi:type I restriction enzyme S subunit